MVPSALRQSSVYVTWSRFLRDGDTWSRDRIEAWQLAQLQSIVAYAFENTEGYRELYRKAGVKPQDIQRLDDIRFLPFTNKQLFQNDLDAFSVKGPRRSYLTTGGSTGIPFGFYNFPELRQIEQAFVHHAWSPFGWNTGARTAVLRGGYVGTQSKPWMYDPYRRELHLSTYHLSAQTLPLYVRKVREYGITILQCYPSSLNILSDILAQSNLQNPFGFEAIFLASENSYGWLLEKAAGVLPGVTLFDFYGQSERVIFAAWCKQSRQYHVNPFYGVTELLNRNSPVDAGSTGTLVGTSFHNRATPFIRYETMDTATRGASGCGDCGRQWDTLAALTGRSHEVIVTGTGRFISMTAMNMHDRLFDRITQFQFHQTERGKVTFRYVPRTALTAVDEQFVRAGLSKKLGSDVDLSMQAVEEIKRTKAGKFRFLDQHLEIPYDEAVER